MKIILSSKVFGNAIATNKLKENVELNSNTSKVLFIPTALGDEFPCDKYFYELLSFGFKKENIIIFNEKEAEKYINLNINVIYISGGNTFTLVKLIKECGFDKEIRKYIELGVPCICRSAGTHLMTKNITHVLNFDENKIGLTDFEAMGIFDGIIFCHYDKNREKFYKKSLNDNQYNVYKITDEEIIIIDDNGIIIK